MVVETYEVDEVKQATVEQDLEAKEIVEALGLEGQAKLYNPQAQDSGERAFPYRKMTAQEKWVYELLLPAKTKLKNYEDGAIPLRVLQVAAHASKLIEGRGAECTLFVWHPKSADYKDPLLVLREGGDWTAQKFWILAHWGEELEEFGVLANKAKEIYRTKCLAKLEECKQQIEVWMRSADAKVHEHYLSGTAGEPAAYWS